MANKKAKAPSDKSSAKPPAAKAEAEGSAGPVAAAPAKPAAKPQVPPKPVPPHQQFVTKGMKPQHMTKARIIRHQGR